ncbi:DNA repair protein RecN [Desulforudis sp. 1088]|uniref:DNA repair protein RecN n=2 Tax=Candidatus Desulforudis TaxID=471826 RepID=UPI003CE55302
MLCRLMAKNFALISDQDLELVRGLNVLTGETGAGKSLVIEALQVGLGQRPSSDVVRAGSDRACVELVFDLEGLDLSGTPVAPQEGFLVLSRDIYRNGRSLYRINGTTVAAAVFREVGLKLVDFHGQGEQQSLLREKHHGRLLDCFGGPELLNLSRRLAGVYARHNEAGRKLDDMITGAKERARRQDTLQFQLDEIDAAGLQIGEEEELESERIYLQNASRIAELADQAYALLYGGDGHQRPAADLLSDCSRLLQELARYVPAAAGLADGLANMVYEVQEQARELARLKDAGDRDPRRLNAIEERLALIGRLKRKYGDSIASILQYRAAIAAEIETLSSAEDTIEELRRQQADLAGQWREIAERLSQLRRDAAARLSRHVTAELRELEMLEAVFAVNLEPVDGMTPHGREEAVFYFAPNPGEPAGPLSRIASGGELSRVMLALRNALAEGDKVPTLVFDEVDAGVGGRALDAVAEKLADISRHHQVICVTHAPQIASFAKRHFQISKEVVQGRTRTLVSVLDENSRLEELSRMLAGKGVSSAVRQHAAELLSRADARRH